MTGFSFEDLKRVWLAEQTSRDLVEIREEFYQRVARHLEDLDLELKRGDSLRQELLEEELRNTMRMVSEIHLFRVLKATDEVIRGRLPKFLLEREKQAFVEMMRIIEKLHAELVAPLKVKKEILKPSDVANVLLIIRAEVPQIVDDSLRKFGPFKGGDVACLPRRSGELMVKHGLATKINVKP